MSKKKETIKPFNMFAISSTLAAAAKAAGIGVVTPGVNLDWSITKPVRKHVDGHAHILPIL